MRRAVGWVLDLWPFGVIPALMGLAIFGGERGSLAAMIIVAASGTIAMMWVGFLFLRALRARQYRETAEWMLLIALGSLPFLAEHLTGIWWLSWLGLPVVVAMGLGLARLGVIRATSPGASSPHISP